MSSSPAPTSSHTASSGSTQAAQATGRSGAQGARKPGGPESAADQFAQLLSLLSASSDPLPQTDGLPADLLQDTPAETPTADSGEAQLEAMMAWAALPTSGAPATGLPAAAAGGADPASRGLPGATTDTGSAPAAATGEAPADSLQGLQVLDQPEALDEQTLAQLQAGTAAEPSSTNTGTPAAVNGAPAAPARPAAWRSTTQMAGTSALQQWHHTQAQAQSTPGAERSAVRIDAGPALSLRSTIALDQRFAQASSDEASLDTPLAAAPLQGALPSALGADQPGHAGTGGDAGAEGGDASDTRDGLRSEGRDETYEDALAEADAQAEERLDSFASPHLRQASLRIGEDSDNAIDVRLSLTGQELDLSFRTDSAEARAELRQGAEGALADLLQRGGIQLGDVSVSDQRGQQGQQGPATPPARPGMPSGRAEAAAAPAGSAMPAPPRPRSDGSRPLDLFV
ncbi:flagellar hook-length control protein FliK [Hydrogenophaga pseudoflava]|uniref:flagellar hook-length control protein FliK n=1 Tax=Hydrogenophaga pseudoflava TaxID=47421 RepID=UPI0027E50FF6|nr:flagellar hook-length control protein FliK [Hydrogenophaga pseudoflava]MDQ7743605.1 flagellar hook-length control protein FliK [Hydrogenophaga pseudoflava]